MGLAIDMEKNQTTFSLNTGEVEDVSRPTSMNTLILSCERHNFNNKKATSF